MKKLLLALTGVLIGLPTFARDFTYYYEGHTLTYTVISGDDKTVMTKVGSSYYPGNNVSGELILPETVYDENNQQYTLTKVGDYAFYNCSDLTSVEIPNSVQTIGEGAFQKCSGLT